GTTFEPKLLALKVNADGRRIDWAATLDNPPPTVTSAAFGIAVKAEGQGTTMVYFTGRRALMPPEQALVLGKLRDEGTTFSSAWPNVWLWVPESRDAVGNHLRVNSTGNAYVVASYKVQSDADAGVLKFGPGGDTLAPGDILHFGSAQSPALQADAGNGLELVG